MCARNTQNILICPEQMQRLQSVLMTTRFYYRENTRGPDRSEPEGETGIAVYCYPVHFPVMHRGYQVFDLYQVTGCPCPWFTGP
jgi:hypothetical protein